MKERRDCHFSGRWKPPDFNRRYAAFTTPRDRRSREKIRIKN
jgi:hypothetical protein